MATVPVIADRLNQWQQESQGPWRLLAFPTYRCNVNCGICIRNWVEKPSYLFHELSDDRWLRLVDEAGALKVRSFVIGGGGEPTLRADLVTAMCVKAKQYGMEGRLQTNGTGLSQEMIETLIKAGWDTLSISLDGPDEASNDFIRYKGAFCKTLATLETLRSTKDKYRSDVPLVSVHLTITAQNYNRLEDMIDLCIDKGIDMFAASPLLEKDLEGRGYILNTEQRAALPGYIEGAIKKADALNFPHTLHNLLMLVQADKDKHFKAENMATCQADSEDLCTAHCLEPWTGIAIDSSGHVSPCCYLSDERSQSIRDMSLAEVWNGAYMTQFRKTMLEGQLRDECRYCSFPSGEEHVDLKKAVQALSSTPKKRAVLNRLVSSIRNYGLRGSYKRYKEWRLIQQRLRNEKSH